MRNDYRNPTLLDSFIILGITEAKFKCVLRNINIICWFAITRDNPSHNYINNNHRRRNTLQFHEQY